MKKRFVSLCLALILALMPLATGVSAEEVVYAHTTEELEAALKSNTTIILDNQDYNCYNLDYRKNIDLNDLQNVTIRGDKNTRLVGASIWLSGCKNVKFKSITFTDFNRDGYALPVLIYIFAGELILEDCIIENVSPAIFGCGDISVKNTTFQNCGTILHLGPDGPDADYCETKAVFDSCSFTQNGRRNAYEYEPGPAVFLIAYDFWPTSCEFMNCTFSDNLHPKFIEDFTDIDEFHHSYIVSSKYRTENCTFSGNAWDKESFSEYLYDTIDVGETLELPASALENVTNSVSAMEAVGQLTDIMTSEQKSSATGVDLATLYAETAAAKAASKAVNSDEIIISAASVADMESAAAQAVSSVETALSNGGVTAARYLSNTVTLTTHETGKISIKIAPDILTTEVDKIRVEAPTYALTLKVADLAEDLTEQVTITAEDVGSGFAPGSTNSKTTVKIDLPKVQMSNPVVVSLPRDSGDVTYQAIVRTDGAATASKFNPATVTVDGRVNASGTYTVKTNEKDFTDITNKSAEMQKAILYLTSRGIINGTSATTFSPDGTINRQQIAALLMRALGKVDNTAKPSFTDVPSSSVFYREIGSSQKQKIINGYADNTFRGGNIISRAQIVTVAGRVLTSEMNYRAPANTSAYLAKYSDAVPDYAQAMVALATREGLVVYRTDGTFSGANNMTRGDAAIILYRLFQKIW